ncbi:coiled-coil domain-containing protein [Nonlabens xiamenensis]|uniref:hypothetical protein n=1 Tax=Nonlabens xiamenensis TaxID=2341043 RepID=UPI000F605DA1|nr:hypothetical protein [Nonlabens xiamenensis]
MKNLYIIIICLFGFFSQAQDATSDKNKIDNQFKEVIESSNDFQEYKVVKRTALNTLRKNTNDHIQQLNQNIDNLEQSIDTKDTRIEQLDQELASVNEELTNVNAEKDSMNFLGIQTNKTVYNTIVWSIVGILAFLFVLMTLRFKNSNAVTKAANKQLKSTEEELEDLRRKSIEKEQRLGRQLQDERNKLARLKND